MPLSNYATSEIIAVLDTKIYNFKAIYPENAGSRFLRKAGNDLLDHTASQLRKHVSSHDHGNLKTSDAFLLPDVSCLCNLSVLTPVILKLNHSEEFNISLLPSYLFHVHSSLYYSYPTRELNCVDLVRDRTIPPE
jgi:hypothetical protein